MGKLVPSSRGRFYPINPDHGSWLIWSYKWNAWHMRSASGGAAGYTADLEAAGIFETASIMFKPPGGISVPGWRVVCRCGIASPKCATQAEAIAAWNTRPTDTKTAQVAQVARAALEWIDALPKDLILPAMPGFDRDWADAVLLKVKQ